MTGIVILTTTPNLKTANALAQKLLEEKLAACVSVKDGWFSTYRWKGKIERTPETQLLIKTAKRNFHRVSQTIQAHHPYDLPEIISLPILQGSAEYLSWLNNAVK